MKIGIYPGSFNPYHVGHHNIYLKSKQIFDKVIVARGINPEKNKSTHTFDSPLLKNVLQITYDGILTDCIKEIHKLNKGTTDLSKIFVIRGFRNLKDVEYQQEQDYWLKQGFPMFKSIYIECEEQYKHVSSSTIKELIRLKQPYKHLIS